MWQALRLAAGTDHGVLVIEFDEKYARETRAEAVLKKTTVPTMDATVACFGSAAAALSLGDTKAVMDAASTLAWTARGSSPTTQGDMRGTSAPRGRVYSSGGHVLAFPSDGKPP